MLNGALLIALVLSLLQTVAPQSQTARRVAITIDDGPVVGEMGDLDRFQRISNGLIGSLAAEKVPATIFINERQLNVPGQRDARAAVLERGSMPASTSPTTATRIRASTGCPCGSSATTWSRAR